MIKKVGIKALLCFFMFTAISFSQTWDAPNGSDMLWCDSANWWFGLGLLTIQRPH
jgi:hypothetical protein